MSSTTASSASRKASGAHEAWPIPAANIGVGDVVAALRNPKTHALDMQLRIAKRNVNQDRLVSGVLGLTHDAHCAFTGESRFQRKARPIRQQRFAPEYRLAGGGNRLAGRLSGIEAARNRIGVNQIRAALKPNRRCQRGFAWPIWARNHRQRGHVTLQASGFHRESGDESPARFRAANGSQAWFRPAVPQRTGRNRPQRRPDGRRPRRSDAREDRLSQRPLRTLR